MIIANNEKVSEQNVRYSVACFANSLRQSALRLLSRLALVKLFAVKI